jgi:hypothetical protein
MKVLRAGGAFARRQSNRAFAGLSLVILGVCLTVFYLVSGLSAWQRVIGAGLLLALILPRLAGRLYRDWVNRERGRAGEELVKGLLPRLSDEYVLVNDVVLPGTAGNIDHVLVGPCGVVVIETKHYSGIVSCRGDRWFRNGAPIRSPSRQAKGEAAALRAYLDRQRLVAPIPYVHSIVVFTDPVVRLKVRDAALPVVRFSELLGVITELGKRRSLSPDLVDRVSRSVVSGSG